MLFFRAFAVWIVIIGVETVHGVVRTLFLAPLVGDAAARRISVFTGALLIFAVALLFIRWIHAMTTRHLLGVGLFWLVLTVLFEIGLGRWVLDLSWDRIAEDYDLTRGGLLGVGLVFMALSPLLASRLVSARDAAGDSTTEHFGG